MRAKNFECKVVWIFIFYVIKDEISFLFFNFFCQNFLLSVLHIYTFFGAVVELREVMLGLVRKAC